MLRALEMQVHELQGTVLALKREEKQEHPLSAKTPVRLDLTSTIVIVGALVGFGAAGSAFVNNTINLLRVEMATKADVAALSAKVDENTKALNETAKQVVATSTQGGEVLRTIATIQNDVRDLRAAAMRKNP
jgi:hypothetical protein